MPLNNSDGSMRSTTGREGAVDDFEDFVRAAAPSLTRVAYVLSGNAHTAEDLLQTALLKTHNAWARIAGMDHREAYVRQIIVREYLSWRRRKSFSEIPVEEIGIDRRDPTSPDPLDRIAETDAMWRLLDGLPRKQRAALMLRYHLDYTDAQIGDAMGCSAGTVRSHISRGLQSLRAPSIANKDGSKP